MKWYCMKNPAGELLPMTLRGYKRDVWGAAFDTVAHETPGFRDNYWKRWDASLRAAQRLGWEIVEVMLVEV